MSTSVEIRTKDIKVDSSIRKSEREHKSSSSSSSSSSSANATPEMKRKAEKVATVEIASKSSSSSASFESSSLKRESTSKNYTPIIGGRNMTVISRHSMSDYVNGHSKAQTLGSGRQSLGFTFSSGLFAQQSAKGVTDFCEHREKERKDMQNLNERLASFIERGRFLEAQNKTFIIEIDKLKKMKGFDVARIQGMFDGEIAQARKIIDELSAQKSNMDVKVVSLEDQLFSERKEHDTDRDSAADWRAKYEAMISRLADNEADMTITKSRMAILEQDVLGVNQSNKGLMDENARLRMDLDSETMAHIQMTNRVQTLEEEKGFIMSVYDSEIQELQAVGQQDNTAEIREYWKGELGKALREIQAEYDLRLDQIRADMEGRYSLQMQQLTRGLSHEAAYDVAPMKEEAKRMRVKITELSSHLQEVESRNGYLEGQLKDFADRLESRDREMDVENSRLVGEVNKLQRELEMVLKEVQFLMDAKLSLELEIAAYRKLLEFEENRLVKDTQVVQQTQVAPQFMKVSESTGKVTIQRSSRGAITFSEVAPDGRYVVVENTSQGKSSKIIDMKGWKIVRELSAGGQVVEYYFDDVDLKPGHNYKIWCKGAENGKEKGDYVATFFSWGTGSSTTRLYDADNAEKASVTLKFKL